MLEEITPLILTLNEEPNIERVLAPLAWARRVVVVDSGSTDDTLHILSRYANVRVFTRAFDAHASQWNFALTRTGIETDWILALDADYVLSEALIEEMRTLKVGSDVSGYAARFRYCVFGEPIRSGAYPPVTILYRRSGATYVQEGHTQRIRVSGLVGQLINLVDHDDRKPLARWLESQRTYAQVEADYLCSAPTADLGPVERLRLMIWPAPILMFVYTYWVRGGVLDSWRGLYYSLQRAYAELVLSLELLDRKLRRAERT